MFGHRPSFKWWPQMLGLWLAFAPLLAVATELMVVASIKPVHSLVAGVMQNVGEPRLLVPGGASPHDYSLKPSDRRVLGEAQIVFWIGPDLESFLTKPLADFAKGRLVALMAAPGVTVLPLREGGAWERDQHEHDARPLASHDAHVWLDPVNAIAMTHQIVAVLSAVDAAHQTDYQRNGAALVARLNQLHEQLTADVAAVQDRPYIVFHDAYQYFERRYGLNAVGAVTLNPEQQPGAKRVAAIRVRVSALNVGCVFAEPQFQPALVDTIVADSGAGRGILDPLGADLPAGPDAYFQLLHNLAAALRSCLLRT